MESADYSSIQELLNEILSENTFSFDEFVNTLMTGNFNGIISFICKITIRWFTAGVTDSLKDLSGLIILFVLFAVLRAAGDAMENKAVISFSEMIIQLIIIARLTTLFTSLKQTTVSYINNSIDLSNTLFPVLLTVSIASGKGVLTAGMFAYAASVTAVVSRVCTYILIPAVSVCLVIKMLDSLLEEKLFDGFSKLLEMIMNAIIKISITAVTGMSVLQLFVIPKADTLRQQTMVKTASMIPGVGNIAETAASVMWGSASLLRGSIGVAGIIGLFTICMMPVFRMMILTLICQILSAVAGIIADKKICSTLNAFSTCLNYLVKITSLTFIIIMIIVGAASL